MWIGLFPELSAVGGIQQVGRHMSAVIREEATKRNVECRLLGLNDEAGRGSFHVGAEDYSFQGFGRNKLRLLSHLLRLAPRLDTLYLGHVNLAPLALLLRLVRPRIKYWVVCHGVEVWQPLSILRRLALRGAKGVFSVSAFTAERVVQVQRLDRARVFLLPPPLDPSFLESSCGEDSLPIPPNARVILTVGRLIASEPGKGVDTIIRVLPDVLKSVPELFYVVVGGGDLQHRLQELARASPARDRILFVGQLRFGQLKHLFSRSDIFAMPSRQEGFGLVFLEAMALGKPVIAGSSGGAREIVQDGVTGFLVNPDDPDTLARCLVQLLGDEDLRRNMGDAGRQRIEENYTFPRFRDRFVQILEAGLS
jgi:phosphatidyl-myo-inositol dimannoside synthase